MFPDLSHLLPQAVNGLVPAGVVLAAGVLAARFALRGRPVWQFLCRFAAFAGFTVLLAAADVAPVMPTPAMAWTVAYVTISVFKAAWWLAAAWLVAGFLRALLVFKRKSVETRFLQDLFAAFAYVGAVLGIIAYVLDIPVSGLLAASGVIAIVLGLALQSTLGDMFSGVVLNLAKPFHPGDWVILDGGIEGRVVETNWRATQILTLMNDLAVVPNSIIAKTKLVNASEPSEVHGLMLTVRLDPAVSPRIAAAMLDTALLSCNTILRVPVATVMIRSWDASALECELTVFVAEIGQAPAARNEVFDRVFRHCASSGIRVAPPAGSDLILPVQPAPTVPEDLPLRLLQHLPLFVSLSEAERRLLAPKMHRRTFKAGDTIVEQGTVPQALFILGSGVLAALQQHEGGEVEMFRLAPGDCFAQASVLTGAPAAFRVSALSQAMVYEIAKADIAPLLQARPGIAAELSQIMAKRETTTRMRLTELDDSAAHVDSLAERLVGRMRTVFGLG